LLPKLSSIFCTFLFSRAQLAKDAFGKSHNLGYEYQKLLKSTEESLFLT
jgi:hypothetical protein